MKRTISKYFRVLAVAPTARGFGFAVLEGQKALIAFGSVGVKGEKNLQSIKRIDKMVSRFRPDVLVLLDVNAKDTHRAPRIKMLHQQIIELAGKHKLKVSLISGKRLRNAILGNPAGTKHEMAEALATHYPNELASRLPPKRRAWASEDSRMDIFDAVALAVAFRMRGK